MATTDESKRRVRRTAIGATLLVTAGLGVAIGSNPFPATQHPASPQLAALTAREKALVRRATVVNARSAQQWHVYRVQLAARQKQIKAVTLANAHISAQAPAGGSSGGGASTASGVSYVAAAPVASTRTS
jgi:hypothetical protein